MPRLLLVACLVLWLLAPPLAAKGKQGSGAHAKAVRKACLKFFKGRSPKKATRLQAGAGRTKSLVLDLKRLRKLFWRYLPAFYKQSLDKKSFLPMGEEQQSLVLVEPRLTRVFVHRDCVSTFFTAKSFTPSKSAYPDRLAARRFTISRKATERWDLWVRQGGKWALARARLPDQKDAKSPNMLRLDRAAVSGEPLLTHPWFAGTLSINEMGTAFYTAREAGRNRDPAATEVRRKARQQETLETLRTLLKTKEIADVGWVESVKPLATGELSVSVSSSWFIVLLQVPASEAKARATFYGSLKKGDSVVFRIRYDPANPLALTGIPRSDGKPTLERFLD